jgi:aspartate kinase
MSQNVIVSKFGGSSMADQVAMSRSAQIAIARKSTIVVVSATYGTTDKLVSLVKNAEIGQWNECEKLLFQLREKHFDICQSITQNQIVSEQLRLLFNELETLARGVFLLQECSVKAKDQILSFGERISSLLFTEVLRNSAKNQVQLFDVRSIMITDSHFGNATALTHIIKNKCKEHMLLDGSTTYVTQGFIGADQSGSTTTLGRGGSDYSAALIAEATNANVLEIWTDVAGIASTDPRICSEAVAINEISYNEASEMAQYGAKILHPTTLVPAMRNNIPVYVGSSYDMDKEGTWIRHNATTTPLVRAITRRSNQSLLTIRTPKMLNAFGFMSSIFDIFSRHRISVDCVTTSEISVAVTVDISTIENEKFISELRQIGEVKYETGYALISLIGNNISETQGVAKNIFNSIDGVNVRMMCLGASDYNFNFLVHEEDSEQAINRLHTTFIGEINENSATW